MLHCVVFNLGACAEYFNVIVVFWRKRNPVLARSALHNRECHFRCSISADSGLVAAGNTSVTDDRDTHVDRGAMRVVS